MRSQRICAASESRKDGAPEHMCRRVRPAVLFLNVKSLRRIRETTPMKCVAEWLRLNGVQVQRPSQAVHTAVPVFNKKVGLMPPREQGFICANLASPRSSVRMYSLPPQQLRNQRR